jgi:hypothetical protein
MLLAAQAIDGGRVFCEPPVEELAVGEFRLEVVGKRCPEGSDDPPIAQATEFMAKRTPRHLLGVGTQHGF